MKDPRRVHSALPALSSPSLVLPGGLVMDTWRCGARGQCAVPLNGHEVLVMFGSHDIGQYMADGFIVDVGLSAFFFYRVLSGWGFQEGLNVRQLRERVCVCVRQCEAHVSKSMADDSIVCSCVGCHLYKVTAASLPCVWRPD